MTELLLKFKDEKGDDKQVSVEGEKFVVGRHTENDLCFVDGRLSRQHIKIERFADIFIVSDCGSSNGTKLNGEDLTAPVALKNADKLNLGGGLEIEVEIVSDDANANNSSGDGNGGDDSADNNAENSAGAQQSASASANNSIPTGVLLLAPILGIFILLLAGGLFLVFSGKTEKETTRNDGGFVYSSKREDATEKENASTDETPLPKATEKPADNSAIPTSPPIETSTTTTTGKTSGDVEKTEQNAASFLRHIAIGDPKAFLTDKQAASVGAKINQLKNSAALAENLKAVKKNSAQIASLASSQNLKPQFLAIAALTKIGGEQRGDPLAVAQTMLPILGELKITLDNKLADDNLLIIAAYDKGAAGSPRALQSTLEALSKQTQNVSPREIRTIWFLKEKGKLSDAEFDFALQFLAIGTIAQNPKDFGINAEPIIF